MYKPFQWLKILGVHKIAQGGIFLLLLAVGAAPCLAGNALSPNEVDWLNGTIKATGSAHPEHKNTDGSVDPDKMMSVAKVSAQQNLLEMIKRLRVSSAYNVATWVGSDQLGMAKIQELIKNAPVIQQAYLSDGTLWLTIEFGLWGAFSQLVLPPEVKPIESITPLDASAKEDDRLSNESGLTGLIVDARGTGLQPALVPLIFDDLGGKVYGPEFINRDFAVQWGVCAYAVEMDTPPITDRVGRNPLIVKGIRVIEPGRTDIVISTAVAGRIRAAVEHVVILREGRVVVLTD